MFVRWAVTKVAGTYKEESRGLPESERNGDAETDGGVENQNH